MAGIRLEWSQFGDFDSFDVIRSTSSMVGIADADLPSPIATNLSTMYFVDTTVVAGATYYYKVRSWRDGVNQVSDQVTALAGTTFDTYVSNLSPIAWLKLDEAAAVDVKDSGILAHSCSVDTLSNLTPRGKVLRKNHAGAMGFAVAEAGVGRVIMAESSEMVNLTKGSHTWFCYHYRTATTAQNRLFGDNGDGVNKRVIRDGYQFPNNARSIGLSFPLNTIIFTAVVYDVERGVYKKFQNGTWTTASYLGPPTSVTAGQSLNVPMTSGYSHYGVRGYISDLAFFNRALANEEIEMIYTLGVL